MYSFEPSDEQKMLVETISRFASGSLRPAAHDADEAAALPANLIKKGWELGVLQASIPEDYGGFGEYSVMTGVLAAEELAYGDLSGAKAIMTPGLFAFPLLLAGSEAQKQEYLPQIVEGNWAPYTAAFIEPSYCFDPAELLTTAVPTGDAFVLSGKKVYVPFADKASAILVYASVDGLSQGFIVPAGTPGLVVGERQKLMGLNALPVFPVTLENVTIPAVNRLGGPDGHDMSKILVSMRLANAAMALGVSRAALDYAVEYAKDREVFGVKVAQKQAIAFMIAEMATEIEAIRLLAWEAAWMADKGLPDAGTQSYLASTGAIDMAMMVTDRAVQILGGHGYIREHPVELWMRNGRGFSVFTGMAMA
jgi:alkylation response protein AidB-like acyl-CoA dehydrogenase